MSNSYSFIHHYNGRELVFQTSEGMFSPQNADTGSLALLSEVKLSGNNDYVLDLGCGYGLIGCCLLSLYPGLQVDMTDIDPEAVELARINLQTNSLEARVFLADGLPPDCDGYTLILSNPPYHTDFSVAKNFIESSFRALAVDGSLMMVVKRLLWYRNKIHAVFGNCSYMEKDGYFILSGEKRSSEKAEKKKTVTKKHQKRMQEAARRKKRRPHYGKMKD